MGILYSICNTGSLGIVHCITSQIAPFVNFESPNRCTQNRFIRWLHLQIAMFRITRKRLVPFYTHASARSRTFKKVGVQLTGKKCIVQFKFISLQKQCRLRSVQFTLRNTSSTFTFTFSSFHLFTLVHFHAN